ncbi:MAG: cupin domain-containing protein [Bacteroidales bacterium]|nr:cupin domain-containing protein [Bacteroidales bacterium]
MNDPDFLIQKYQLQPHPEGGYYREVYRSDQELLSPVVNEKRNTVSHIYFLLKQGQFSRFHRVLHDEIWNFYGGSPLKIIEFDGINIEEKIIGKENESYFSVIQGGVFQAAESTGEFSFVGCSVAPGFDFKDFSFLTDEPEMLASINKKYPEYKSLV